MMDVIYYYYIIINWLINSFIPMSLMMDSWWWRCQLDCNFNRPEAKTIPCNDDCPSVLNEIIRDDCADVVLRALTFFL